MRFHWQTGVVQQLPVRDQTLEVQCFGPSPTDAPTLVLLHEGLGCLALWRDFPQALSAATGCGVMVYSRAGYGQSSAVTLPRPLNYMTIEATSVLPALLDQMDIQTGVLLGHSDGASIVAIYAGTVSDVRVRGLVLIAPHFFTEPDQLDAIREARHAFEHGELRTKLARYHADVDMAFYGWNDAWLDTRFKHWNISEHIERWQLPALVLQGSDDQYGTLAQVQVIETRSCHAVDIREFAHCGHSPHLECPEATLSAVAGFLVELGLTGTPRDQPKL